MMTIKQCFYFILYVMVHMNAITRELPVSMLIFLQGMKFLLLSSSYIKKISTYSALSKHFLGTFDSLVFMVFFVVSNF